MSQITTPLYLNGFPGALAPRESAASSPRDEQPQVEADRIRSQIEAGTLSATHGNGVGIKADHKA